MHLVFLLGDQFRAALGRSLEAHVPQRVQSASQYQILFLGLIPISMKSVEKQKFESYKFCYFSVFVRLRMLLLPYFLDSR